MLNHCWAISNCPRFSSYPNCRLCTNTHRNRLFFRYWRSVITGTKFFLVFFHLILILISNIFLLVLLNFCFFYTTESTYVLFCIHFVYHQMIASNEIKLRSQLSERIHLHCWWGFALQFVFFSFFPFSPGFSKEVALLFMDRAQSKAPSSPSKKKVVFQPNDLNRLSTRRHARLRDTTLDEMSNWHGHITIPSTDKVLYPFRWRNAIYLLRSPTSSICLFF